MKAVREFHLSITAINFPNALTSSGSINCQLQFLSSDDPIGNILIRVIFKASIDKGVLN